MIKNKFTLFNLILLCAFTLFACNKKTVSNNSDEKITIVSTIFPEYDWIKNITSGVDKIENLLLIKNGVDLHSYQPSVQDVIQIVNSDLFVYVGGESDSWVKDLLSANPGICDINLLSILKNDVKEEEVVEGMQVFEEEEEESEEEVEYDEHVWLSLKLTKKICVELCNKLCSLDFENKDLYQKNLSDYLAKISALDTEFTKLFEDSSINTILFCDRFPFRYFCDDYNIDYFAAFLGCSAETEASFETMAFLTEKINELNLKNVFVLEKSDKKIANTVIQNSNSKNQKIYTLDSVQSITSKEIEEGKDYLSIMQENLLVFEQIKNEN